MERLYQLLSTLLRNEHLGKQSLMQKAINQVIYRIAKYAELF
jgi:hypothetical protein